MADFGNDFDAGADYESKKSPVAKILAFAAIAGLLALAYHLVQESRNEKARKEIIAVLDQELTNEDRAIKEERQKIVDLTREIDMKRGVLQSGKHKKADVEDFNKLAAQQRAEREKFTQMAEEYNKKVAKLQEMEK